MTNKELVERYPFLAPDWTELDEMPTGWREAFGEMMCEEIRDELLKHNALDEYRIDQIKEKYGCYDPETEVLTNDGWKPFNELSYQDEIATLNPDTEHIEYQHPSDIIAYQYTGKMYEMVNRGVDIKVTPNHNLYLSKGSYYNGSKNNLKRTYEYELATPKTYFGKDKRFKKGGLWEGVINSDVFTIKGYTYTNHSKLVGDRIYVKPDLQLPVTPFLRFLGFYIAEGCCNPRHYNQDRLSFSAIDIAYNYKSEEIEQIVKKLIEDIGLTVKRGGLRSKRIYNATLAKWLYENCGHYAWNKKVPNFIKSLPPKYIEEFLTYLYLGDGHKTETAHILYTTSKQLSDDVQELLLKAGYAFRENKRDPRGDSGKVNGRSITGKHGVYEINWLKNTEIEVDMSKARNTESFVEQWSDYSGMVYCVTVPNRIIYVRRNGKGYWCGNSLRWYDNGYPPESRIGDIIGKYETLSKNICIHCGKPDVAMTGNGWILPLCEDCYNGDYSEWDNRSHKMSDVYRYRQYKDGEWHDVEVDISETAQKIRDVYYNEHKEN